MYQKWPDQISSPMVTLASGAGPGGGGAPPMVVLLDLDLGANLKAHRTPGEGLDGFPNGSAYWPAMSYEALPCPWQASPSVLSGGGSPGSRVPPPPLLQETPPRDGSLTPTKERTPSDGSLAPPPPLTMQGTHDTKQDRQITGHMSPC